MDIENKVHGFLRSAGGGGLSAQALPYQQGAVLDVWKQVGKPKFEDISLAVGMGMSPEFYKWIAAFFTRKIERKNGAIVIGDFNYKERARRKFQDALISEVQIATLDATSREAGYMTVKIVPEYVEYETINNGPKIDCPDGLRQPSKLWTNANFRFTVDGYNDAFKRVSKIDGFSIKQQILEYPYGHRRHPVRVPGRIEWPTLSVYIPAVDAKTVIAYAKQRLLDYKAGPAGKMNGSLTFLGPDRAELCTISLKGVDIISAEPQPADATSENIATVKTQIQVESMTFEYQSSATA